MSDLIVSTDFDVFTPTTIARFLDEAMANVDQTIDRYHREIDLLRKYRTCLIADVVTSKLDVSEPTAQMTSFNASSDDSGNETVQATSNPRLPKNILGQEALQ